MLKSRPFYNVTTAKTAFRHFIFWDYNYTISILKSQSTFAQKLNYCKTKTRQFYTDCRVLIYKFTPDETLKMTPVFFRYFYITLTLVTNIVTGTKSFRLRYE